METLIIIILLIAVIVLWLRDNYIQEQLQDLTKIIVREKLLKELRHYNGELDTDD